MKRIIYSLTLILFIASCSTEKTPDQIKKQIDTYKSQVVEIESQILALETELKSLGGELESNAILVTLTQAKSVPFTHYIDLVGSIESNKEAYVSPELNGLITSIDVVEGQNVSKGQVLAHISSELNQKTIEEVRTQLELANTMYEKQKALWDQKVGTEVQYLQAKSNKESLEKRLESLKSQQDMAVIRAPFDGYIEDVYQKVGEFGAPSRQMFHIINISDLKVIADVSEAYLPYIKTGALVNVSFPTFPDVKTQLQVDVVGKVINPDNRTFKIQISLPSNLNQLRPNIIANLQLADMTFDSAIVVPSIVVKTDAQGKSYLYESKELNKKMIASKVFIQIGKSYGNETMVISGIKPGSQIITQGYNMVKDGSEIKTK